MTEKQVQVGGTAGGIRLQLRVKWGRYPVLARRIRLTVGKFAVVDEVFSAESAERCRSVLGEILGDSALDSDRELLSDLLRALSEVVL